MARINVRFGVEVNTDRTEPVTQLFVLAPEFEDYHEPNVDLRHPKVAKSLQRLTGYEILCIKSKQEMNALVIVMASRQHLSGLIGKLRLILSYCAERQYWERTEKGSVVEIHLSQTLDEKEMKEIDGLKKVKKCSPLKPALFSPCPFFDSPRV